MKTSRPWLQLPSRADWRERVWPREHGSWSLAFEPVVFGLLAAPSADGALLAVAVAGAFLARRPLRCAWQDPAAAAAPAARGALLLCLAGAAAAGGGVVVVAGVGWIPWLLPAMLGGALFLWFDLRGEGREGAAEVAGSAAFATLPAVMASLADRSPATAIALAAVMAGRAVPTVLTVRAVLRGAKSGNPRGGGALLSALVALGVGLGLAARGDAPMVAPVALGLLAARTVILLLAHRRPPRARTLGLVEAVLGVLFVGGVGWAWRE